MSFVKLNRSLLYKRWSVKVILFIGIDTDWGLQSNETPRRRKRARSPGLPASSSSPTPQPHSRRDSSLPPSSPPPPFSDTEGESADDRDAVQDVIGAEDEDDEGEDLFGPGIDEYVLPSVISSPTDVLQRLRGQRSARCLL